MRSSFVSPRSAKKTFSGLVTVISCPATSRTVSSATTGTVTADREPANHGAWHRQVPGTESGSRPPATGDRGAELHAEAPDELGDGVESHLEAVARVQLP